jgi:hypothetical protein
MMMTMMMLLASLPSARQQGKTKSQMDSAASMNTIFKKAGWEIATHAISISTSLFVASKYSAIPPMNYKNLETLLL